MNPSAPRLLVVLRETAALRSAIAARLPGVPFAFFDPKGDGPTESVSAVLVGSVHGDAAGFEPSRYPNLRFIQRFFAGVDDLPFDRIPPGVAVAGNVGGMAPFVAEHAIALALACARCVLEGSRSVAAGRARPQPELRTLYRETAVILGFGAIAAALADRLRPFEMTVVGLNRSGRPAEGVARMFPADRLREAVAAGGYVFDVRPLTTRTRGTLGAPEFRGMREDATFVNVGRAGTVIEEALYRALVERPRFRAGVDVWWEEDLAGGTLSSRFPFSDLPNFVGTPHWAGFSPRVQEHALGTSLANLARFFAGAAPEHVVDRSEYPEALGGGF